MALTDNLVSYWKLDESSGNAADSVGSNTATNTSVTYASAKINNGGVFNGTSSKFVVANHSSLQFTTDFSISVWAKWDVVGSSTAHRLLDKFENNGRTYALYGYHDGSKYVIEGNVSQTGANTNNFVVTSPSGISADTWYHIVLSKTGTNLRLYVNGSNVATNASAPTNIYSNSQDLAIGVISFTASQYFDGVMDEIGMWSRGITGAEVTELYNSGNGNQYPFVSPFTPKATWFV